MKKLALLLAMSIIFSSFVSCSNDEKQPSESDVSQSVSDSADLSKNESSQNSEETNESSQPSDKTEDIIRNPLTGETGYNENAVGKRPVAVMINNIKAALPQYGIEQADILFEVLVEGGITRLMGVYADYTAVPEVCSVRSCRYYYPVIAMGFDAVYCHIGYEQTYAKAKLQSLGIDTVSDTSPLPYNSVFAVDSERAKTYSSEHTKYLVGPNLAQAFVDNNYRTDIGEEYKGDYFEFKDEFFAPEGVDAKNVNLKFSASYYSTFEYDESTKTYKKFHSGSEHIDGKTGNQLSYTNVIALQTEVYPKPENTYLMNVDLVGSGTGYYISGGKAAEISWKKDSEASKIEFFDSQGDPLTVNVGKCYIGILDNSATITFE